MKLFLAVSEYKSCGNMTAMSVHSSVNGGRGETRVVGLNEKNMKTEEKQICGGSKSTAEFIVCPANGSSPKGAAVIEAAGKP